MNSANPQPIVPQVSRLAEVFLDSLVGDTTVSRDTVRGYSFEVNRFAIFLVEKCKLQFVNQLGVKHIHSHLIELSNRGLSKTSRAKALNAIRAWNRWLARAGHVQHSVAELVDPIRPSDHLPNVPSPTQISIMLDLADKSKTGWPARDKAICEVLYGCGAANRELRALNIDDIQFKNQQIVIRAKGGRKQRFAPIGNAAADALRIYIEERSAWLEKKQVVSPALFVNEELRGSGKPGFEARVSSLSLQHTVKRIAILAGLPKDVTARTLRWACGAHMLNQGADIEIVKTLLGISGTRMTGVLQRLRTAPLEAAMDRTHPRATLKPDVRGVS
jgi:integrase/recombinase XerC